MPEFSTRLCGDTDIVDYLFKAHGIKLSSKTSRNLRAAGKGPEVHYFGSRVYTTATAVDHWVANRITNATWSRRRGRSAVAPEMAPEAA
jgi:hypothetical protein